MVTSSHDYGVYQLDLPVHPGALWYIECARVREVLCFGGEFSLAAGALVGTKHVLEAACAVPLNMELRVRGGQSLQPWSLISLWVLSCILVIYSYS